MQRRKCEASTSTCQLRGCRRSLSLCIAVKPVLLSFLTKHGAENFHQGYFFPTVEGEGDLCPGNCTKGEIGDCLSEQDRFCKGADREGVLAGSDRGLAAAEEESID